MPSEIDKKMREKPDFQILTPASLLEIRLIIDTWLLPKVAGP